MKLEEHVQYKVLREPGKFGVWFRVGGGVTFKQLFQKEAEVQSS